MTRIRYPRILISIVFFSSIVILLPAYIHTQPSNIPRILLVTHKDEGFTNGFWNALRGGAEQASKKAGIPLEYRGVPPEYQSNRPAGQDAVIKTALSTGVSGILITPSDSFRLAATVKTAVLQGIPIVSVDSAIESNLLSGVVITNNYEGGLAAAEHMVKLCGGTGGIVMMVHPSRGNKATLDREQAFVAGLSRFGPKMTLLSAERSGGATIDTDYQAALQLIKDFPNLKGLYSVSGSGLIGTYRALRDTGKAGKVILIGWDADAETIAALERGEVHAIMQQDPAKMAELGVELLIAAIKGNPEEKFLNISPTLITPRNLTTPEVQLLLAPLGL